MKTSKPKSRRKQSVGTLLSPTTFGSLPQSVSGELSPGGLAVAVSFTAPAPSAESNDIERCPIPNEPPNGARARGVWRAMKRVDDWATKGVPLALSDREIADKVGAAMGDERPMGGIDPTMIGRVLGTRGQKRKGRIVGI
jgi:hypothetical protein